VSAAGFARTGGVLCADGVALDALAREHGTPLYAYSRARLESAYDAYARAFSPVPHRVCYALKANSNGALLRVLAARGAGADVVSGGELRAALRAGFAPERVVFSGVGKTDDELALGLEAGIGEFNAESEAELRRLSELACACGLRARVALRVNPDIDPRSHPYISTGLRESKFGVDARVALDLLRRARAWPGLEITGVSAHIGSQIADLEPLVASARELALLARTLLAEGFPLRTIDLGGGLGVDYEGDGRAPSPAALGERVLPLVRDLGLELLLEPGRSLVGPAGVLLARVLYVKASGAKRFVIVDAAMNDLLRPALYAAHHRIERVVAGASGERFVADVVGPVCETGDFLALNRAIDAVQSGDLLALMDAGAYGFSMGSTYNMRPRPAEVLCESGQARLIRRRETFEDLVRTELP
jgi:diaminopimelate decarboxylase